MEYIRLGIFLFLWGLFFWNNWGIENLTIYLFVCALSFIIFFLSPLMKRKYVFPYIQIIIFTVSFFSANEVVFLYFIVYQFLMIMPDVSVRAYLIQAVVSVTVCLILLLVQNELTMGWFFSLLSIAAIAVYCKKLTEENRAKKDMYTGLLQEYRMQKRQAFHASNQVRLEERTRIAREIHDSVGHKLTALLMQIKMKVIDGDESCEDLLRLAEDSLQETRYAVKKLQSDSPSGIESVLQLIRKLESESRISVQFTTEKGVLSAQLTNDQSAALYRMLQEALTNAMKHADSREVKVILNTTAAKDMEFTVRNKVKEQLPIRYGFGLENMQERILELGGRLRVYYSESDYVVRGTFPLERK